MKPSTYKIGTRIWTPLLTKLSQRMDTACLRRDAYLSRVLDHELNKLDAEIVESNSDAARQFICAHLDALPRKLVTLTLPDRLLRQLDDICERKRIVRDSFFNRLFFMLAAEPRILDRMWFDDQPEWFSQLLEKTDLQQEAAAQVLEPIQTNLDPFWAYREGLAARYEGNPPVGVYSAVLDNRIFSKVDLFGLNVYLPDSEVPGTAEYHKFATLLDDLLADDAPPGETPA